MTLQAFEHQNYLNLETLRKSGQAVRTPVWFVQDGEVLYIWTEANSGKAKRVRHTTAVRITPCTASGEPLAEWQPARAHADASTESMQHVESLMRKKYKLMFHFFRIMGRLIRRKPYTTIEIRL